MRLIKSVFIALSIVALGGLAFAQQPVTAPTQKPATPAVLPKGKIAVINTGLFQEQVAEFKEKIDSLNRQFEPRVKEVQTLADKINALETTIKSQGQVLAAAKIAEMTENLESMKREYQRKSEDLQAEGGRARDKAFEPITGKLGKFAEEYTNKRGIVMLVDIANAVQSGIVVWFDPRSDVTQDFINEYNKANPITTGAKPTPK